MSSRARPSVPPQTKLLSPGMQWLYRISFVLCLCVAGVAAVGVFTIADAEERKYKLSHTQFAQWFYSLVQFNQATPGLMLNGSLIGAMASFLQLRNDGLARQARLLANVKVLSDAEVDALREEDGGNGGRRKKENKKSR